VRHLTAEELSERLGGGRIGTATLKSWRTTGHGPSYLRVGKYVLYRVADVEAWEESRLRHPEE
jgi:hypothetical protein